MIPKHLVGKNAVEIVSEQRDRFIAESYHDIDERVRKRIARLEMLLILAVGDALCNCDQHMRVNELIAGVTDGPGDRGIAFLNTVLPNKEG